MQLVLLVLLEPVTVMSRLKHFKDVGWRLQQLYLIFSVCFTNLSVICGDFNNLKKMSFQLHILVDI